jgi:prepilin-type N-terminal cleavage/methylation domain-containing protein
MITRKNQTGFTLIELLIVVAIIGILAAIAIPNFLEAQVRARVARAASEMRALAMSNEAYHVDFGQYMPSGWSAGIPAPGGWAEIADGAGNLQPSFTFHCSLTTPISYISSYPTDPFNEQVKQAGDYPSWYAYWYQDPLAGPEPEWGDNWFKFTSVGPDKVWGDEFGDPTIPYDATNGTVSGGDIRYFGGETSRLDDAGELGFGL